MKTHRTFQTLHSQAHHRRTWISTAESTNQFRNGWLWRSAHIGLSSGVGAKHLQGPSKHKLTSMKFNCHEQRQKKLLTVLWPVVPMRTSSAQFLSGTMLMCGCVIVTSCWITLAELGECKYWTGGVTIQKELKRFITNRQNSSVNLMRHADSDKNSIILKTSSRELSAIVPLASVHAPNAQMGSDLHSSRLLQQEIFAMVRDLIGNWRMLLEDSNTEQSSLPRAKLKEQDKDEKRVGAGGTPPWTYFQLKFHSGTGFQYPYCSSHMPGLLITCTHKHFRYWDKIPWGICGSWR